MEQTELTTLLIIVACAFVCPILASIVPRKIVPETVFLLVAGMVIGPHVLGWAQMGDAVTLLSDLGLGFLFLLAGYEINPAELTDRQGKNGLLTWIVSFAVAMGVIVCLPHFHENELGWFAVAIALTTTAFGTLVPILKDRGIANTPLGRAIVAYGTWGEIGPILAVALLLSTRAAWTTVLILAIFTAIAVATAVIPARLRHKSQNAVRVVSENAETNAQMTVRGAMMLLVGLLAVSSVFDLDIVLGAFAAGFSLRFILPEGNDSLEHKLNGIGYGFFIPLFFIVSGAKIDPAAVTAQPLLLLLFIGMLLLVRGLPIFLALTITRDAQIADAYSRMTVALYCTTALPLIVAVTAVAVGAGAMEPDTASLLVAAGGITVLLMPLIAGLTARLAKCGPRGECVEAAAPTSGVDE